jgi:predicted ATPase
MPDSSQHDFRATELDPDIFSSAFGVQTNWHVITGAPCSGKTTLIDHLANHRYASVFILDLLPFQENGARDEDAAKAVYLDEWLARDYSALGYRVVRVPVLSPQERLAFVLERLSEQGLI